MRTGLLVAITIGFFSIGSAARAGEKSNTRSAAEVIGYSIPAAGAAFAISVNGLAMALDEGTTRPWKVMGYVTGALELGIAGFLISQGPETRADYMLAYAPVGLGVAAIATALLAPLPPEEGVWSLVPQVGRKRAGLQFSLRF